MKKWEYRIVAGDSRSYRPLRRIRLRSSLTQRAVEGDAQKLRLAEPKAKSARGRSAATEITGAAGVHESERLANAAARDKLVCGCLLLDLHVHAHPGVNAALIVVGPCVFVFRLGPAAGRNELFDERKSWLQGESGAFGSNLLAVIQLRKEPAAKLIDFGESMDLATVVSRLELFPLLQVHLAGTEHPPPDTSFVEKLLQEGVETDAGMASQTGAIAERRIEG